MIATRLAVPAVVLVVDLIGSAVTWLGWEAAGRDGQSPALAVLLIAAPVGLVAAALLPGWMARRVGRGLGVGAIAPEAPELWHRVRSLVLDPQASLTTGRLVVTGVHAEDPDHERNLRWFAGALAHSYDDPVGRAVAKLAGRGRVTDVALVPGRGIRGSVDRHPVRVGEPEWIGGNGAPQPEEVGTTVAVEVDQRQLGRITVAEEVRADASRQLGRLRRSGLNPVLASPGGEESVARLARLSASPEWHAETDPDRLAHDLAAAGEPVGLVRTTSDGATTLVVVERDARGQVQHRGVTSTVSAAVDRLVHAVALTLCLRRSRRRAVILTCVLMVLAIPFAVLGLLPPLAALALALLIWAAAVVTAVAGFAGIRQPEEAG